MPGETGAYLQFGMVIKGSADAALDGTKRFTLATDAVAGNNVSLELSDKVYADGAWVPMADGYPKVEMQSSKQLFIFRMPRFSTSALYDPLIDEQVTPTTCRLHRTDHYRLLYLRRLLHLRRPSTSAARSTASALTTSASLTASRSSARDSAMLWRTSDGARVCSSPLAQLKTFQRQTSVRG